MSKSWRSALSIIERVHVEFRLDNNCSNDEMLRLATSQLQNINNLSICDGRKDISLNWDSTGRLVASCSSKLKHFMFCRETVYAHTTANNAFDSLQNSTPLESLTLENIIFEEIGCIERILQNKTRLRKLNLEKLTIRDPALHGDDAETHLGLLAQIGKLHTLRELHLTSYHNPIREFDTAILLSGLKNLQHLHICVHTEKVFLTISRYCPALNLKYLRIEDYGSPDGTVRLNHVVLNYLQSSKIHTLVLRSSFYDDADYACSAGNIIRLCRPNTTLRRLVVGIATSNGANADDLIAFAADESKGCVKLIPLVVGY